VRKVIIALGASAVTVVLAGVGADTGAAVYAEYQLARHVRSAADLTFDPWVAILGFPFLPQAMRHRYHELEIKANGVEHPVVGNVTLESTMHDIGLSEASWLMRPDADLPVGMLESRIIIDSRHLGTFLGIKDLAPTIRPAAPPSPESPETRGWSFPGRRRRPALTSWSA
jgi:hypothetical protein